jgi:hypothetical protein
MSFRKALEYGAGKLTTEARTATPEVDRGNPSIIDSSPTMAPWPRKDALSAAVRNDRNFQERVLDAIAAVAGIAGSEQGSNIRRLIVIMLLDFRSVNLA